MTLPLIYQPWFEQREYLSRLERVQARLRAEGLDGLLVFQPENCRSPG